MNFLDELKSLDPKDPGRWPLAVRGFFVLLVFALCTVAFSYMFVWTVDRPVLQKAEADELDLRTQFENKQQRAANLDAYKQQLGEMERSFGAMLRQLPGKTEVPNLLVDISQTGLAAGLSEKLFQPGPEKSNGFYAELPIKIRLVGSYHQFGAFVSGIAALPRIVTLHDIQIGPVRGEIRGQLRRSDHGRDREDVSLHRRRGPQARRQEKDRRRDVTIRIGDPSRARLISGARIVCAIALVGCVTAACSGGQSDLQRWIAETKKKPGGRIQPLPEVKPYESFVYSASNLRSPFQPASPNLANGAGVRPTVRRNREFLEGFSLDTLKMVGTFKVGNNFYGLVQSKDGLVHKVQPGNYLGQNDGKVTEITGSKISLVEIIPDGLGGYIERPASLALQD